MNKKTLTSSAIVGLIAATAVATPASALPTSYYGKNEKASFTGAIFHACTKGGSITGRAYIAEKGQTVKVKGSTSGSLGVYIPAKSSARVTRNGVKVVTYHNNTSKGRDFCGISRAARTTVYLYR